MSTTHRFGGGVLSLVFKSFQHLLGLKYRSGITALVSKRLVFQLLRIHPKDADMLFTFLSFRPPLCEEAAEARNLELSARIHVEGERRKPHFACQLGLKSRLSSCKWSATRASAASNIPRMATVDKGIHP